MILFNEQYTWVLLLAGWVLYSVSASQIDFEISSFSYVTGNCMLLFFEIIHRLFKMYNYMYTQTVIKITCIALLMNVSCIQERCSSPTKVTNVFGGSVSSHYSRHFEYELLVVRACVLRQLKIIFAQHPGGKNKIKILNNIKVPCPRSDFIWNRYVYTFTDN